MKIVLATPLYPPEIAAPAPYVKELAKRLSKLHAVTLVAYARLPEQVPSVSVCAVDKRQPRVVRILSFTRALRNTATEADAVYAVNGASVELPLILLYLNPFLRMPPLFFCIADPKAEGMLRRSPILWCLAHTVRLLSRDTITALPLPRPEILSFAPEPTEELAEYERSWKEHLRSVSSLLTHAR